VAVSLEVLVTLGDLMTEIRVEYLDFEEVEAWPRNPKDHDLHEIRKSFYRFGFIKPVLVDEGTGRLVAGHGRLDTLRLLKDRGIAPPRGVQEVEGKWLIPVLRGVKFNDPAEAEAFLLADNRISEIGGWKQDVLDSMIEEMSDVDGLLEGTGFEEAGIDKILEKEKESLDKIESVYTTPYNKVHVMLSFDPSVLHKVTPIIEALREIDGVEYDTATNIKE
jgi:hypothetical protein